MDTSGFNLNGLARDLFAPPQSVSIKHRFVSLGASAVEHDENQRDYAVFVDVGVRCLDHLEFEGISWLDITKIKMKADDINIESQEKFSYTYDIGYTKKCQSTMARLVPETSQKQELARKIVRDTISNGNKTLVVSVLGEFGEVLLDLEMMEAVYSALQLSKFSMPTLKKGSTLISPSDNISSATSAEGEDGVVFVVPEWFLDNKKRLEMISKETANSAWQTEDETDTESSTRKWHYFKEDGELELREKIQKNTKIEQKILTNQEKFGDGTKNIFVKAAREETAKLMATEALTKPADAPSEPTNNRAVDRIFNWNKSSRIESYSSSTNTLYWSKEEVEKRLERAAAINHGTNIARALTSLPPNVLTPRAYADFLRSVCSTEVQKDWELTVWSVKEVKEMGCGGFAAVVAGNKANNGDCLVRIRVDMPSALEDLTTNKGAPAVRPITTSRILNLGAILRENLSKENENVASGASNAPTTSLFSLSGSGGGNHEETPIVLVGKGITFDTGGVNVKGASSMKTMKGDMAGSSAALGTLFALSKMKVSYPLECWLAIAENNIGPDAFRPDDVLQMVTGTSVEVVNTDAEGRLVLADLLALASRKANIVGINSNTLPVAVAIKPKILLDYATLTGTAITSLSNRYIAVMSNREDSATHEKVITAGRVAGERLWPMPTDDDYNEDLKSDVADLLQCRQPTEADHIYAAKFLQHFVAAGVPWFHFDLASSHRPGGLGLVGTDFTGAGVRSSIALLDNYI